MLGDDKSWSFRRILFGALIVLLAAGGVFVLAGGLLWINEFLAVDDCLDRGGAYDYREKTCIGPASDRLSRRRCK